MKQLIVILAILFSISIANAQYCEDIIHTQNNNILFDCCIDEVQDGNIVFYTKNGKSHVTAATMILKDGSTIKLESQGKEDYYSNYGLNNQTYLNSKLKYVESGLYEGHDYNYYAEKYKKATAQRKSGVTMTVIGLFGTAAGVALISNQKGNTTGIGTGILLGSFISFNVGLPMWISGAAKRKNNRKAMEQSLKNTPDLKRSISLGATENGFGLVMNL